MRCKHPCPNIKLKVLIDTYFKEEPKQGAELSDDQKLLIDEGKEFPIHSYDMSVFG